MKNLRERDQDRSGYHLALGALDLRQKKDEASAESEFKEALKLDPSSSAAHLALGNLYWRRQDLNAADQAFKAAADLAPPRSPIRLRYVDFKLRTGAATEAKNILEDMSAQATRLSAAARVPHENGLCGTCGTTIAFSACKISWHKIP